MLIGKTFWKGLALANILYGMDIVYLNEAEINKLQVQENKAFRVILRVPERTAAVFLRGEVGASSSKARDIKNKISFLKHCLGTEEDTMLKQIVKSGIENRKTKWAKQVIRYLEIIDLNLNQLILIKKAMLENKIRNWDTEKWKEEVARKSTLNIYSILKDKPDEVKWYRNGIKFSLMMQARADALNLGWRGFELDKSKICKICECGEEETLLHFILDCARLQGIRMKYLLTQLPRQENKRKLLLTILLLDVNQEELADLMTNLIYELWVERLKIKKSIQ